MEFSYKGKIIFSLIVLLLGYSCTNSTLDFSGFFYSTDKIDSRFDDSQTWNQVHPFKNIVSTSDDYKLLVAADSHVGGLEHIDSFIQEALKPSYLAYVLVGDMVTGKSADYTKLDNFLPKYDVKPRFLMAGNHELYFGGWQSFKNLWGTSIYYFTISTPSDSDLYICLDSGSGTLGDKQLAWLKNVLKETRPSYRNCVVFTHVNFFRNRHTGSTNPLVPEIEILIDLFAKSNVDMVLMGHDHVRSLNNFGKTTYVTMDGLLDDNPNASYVILQVAGGKLDYAFKSIK